MTILPLATRRWQGLQANSGPMMEWLSDGPEGGTSRWCCSSSVASRSRLRRLTARTDQPAHPTYLNSASDLLKYLPTLTLCICPGFVWAVGVRHI